MATTTEREGNEMTIEVIQTIQSAVSERIHAGYDDMSGLIEKYTDQGYYYDEVEAVVASAVQAATDDKEYEEN